MKPASRRFAGLLLAGAGLAAVAGIGLHPAIGQDAPESILPPGFGEPTPAPAPAPTPAPGAPPRTAAPGELLPPVALDVPAEEEDVLAEGDEPEEEVVEPLELPEYARRSLDAVGPLEGDAGLGGGAFRGADGRFLTGLMRRLDAPVASRWASILLRRALLTRVETPAGVAPINWVTERAFLLLRMGEADAARMLVQSVDVDRFDQQMYAVAAQSALATADPAGLCPLAPGAATFSKEPIWPMATAMCAALSGEASVSSALIDRVRQGKIARGIDLRLAEKVVGAGANGRRAVNIEWTGVDRLTAWRFGLASALAVPIPQELFASVGPHVLAWRARAPMLTAQERIGPARLAATLGVLSNAALVDLYGAAAESIDVADLGNTDAGRLRTAYVGDPGARIASLRTLWTAPQDPADRYAAAILTARAAAGIAPDAANAPDAAALIAAMLSAGLDTQAERWSGVVQAMAPADADAAWALLAVGAPRPQIDLGAGRIGDYRDRRGADGVQKARMLVAALAGLGRLRPNDQAALAESVQLDLAMQDVWTRALDRAVAGGEQGTVALLVAAAMQTRDWHAVPSRHFFHMIRALRGVGLEPEARMIAAEAMTRL